MVNVVVEQGHGVVSDPTHREVVTLEPGRAKSPVPPLSFGHAGRRLARSAPPRPPAQRRPPPPLAAAAAAAGGRPPTPPDPRLGRAQRGQRRRRQWQRRQRRLQPGPEQRRRRSVGAARRAARHARGDRAAPGLLGQPARQDGQEVAVLIPRGGISGHLATVGSPGCVRRLEAALRAGEERSTTSDPTERPWPSRHCRGRPGRQFRCV